MSKITVEANPNVNVSFYSLKGISPNVPDSVKFCHDGIKNKNILICWCIFTNFQNLSKITGEANANVYVSFYSLKCISPIVPDTVKCCHDGIKNKYLIFFVVFSLIFKFEQNYWRG